MFCENCGSEISNDAVFCENCGMKVSLLINQKKVCKKCGVELTQEVSFCPNCGTSVNNIENQELKISNFVQSSSPNLSQNYPTQTIETNLFCLIGFICSLIGFWVGWAGVVSLVLCIIGLVQVKEKKEKGKKLAIAGIVIQSIGFIITICLGVGLIANSLF